MHAFPPTAQQFLSSSGVKVKAVQQRLQQHIPHQQWRPNSVEAQQVWDLGLCSALALQLALL